MKQRIRLTESQLHNVIKNSVKRVLREVKLNTSNLRGHSDATDKLADELDGVSVHGNNLDDWEKMYQIRQAIDNDFENERDWNKLQATNKERKRRGLEPATSVPRRSLCNRWEHTPTLATTKGYPDEIYNDVEMRRNYRNAHPEDGDDWNEEGERKAMGGKRKIPLQRMLRSKYEFVGANGYFTFDDDNFGPSLYVECPYGYELVKITDEGYFRNEYTRQGKTKLVPINLEDYFSPEEIERIEQAVAEWKSL